MIEIRLTDSPDQEFSLSLEGKAVTMRVRWNGTANHWHMDLNVEGVTVLNGKRIVLESDLVEPYRFGIGRIFAVAATDGAEPTRDAFADRSVRLYQANDADLVEAEVAV